MPLVASVNCDRTVARGDRRTGKSERRIAFDVDDSAVEGGEGRLACSAGR